MSVRKNLERVRERIAQSAEKAGRDPCEITLVGVTKYVDATAAAELVAAGCHDLGESRPQQLAEKVAVDELAATKVRWHLIGHLQRNKVGRTLPLVTLIHSVDSLRLLQAIHNRRLSTTPQILLEVNCSGDREKHGLQPEEVEPLLAMSADLPGLQIRGLMTMAAREGGEAVAARNFAALRTLRDRLQNVAPASVELKELSMGMSGDFEIAIREGATIVRIGSALWKK